MGHSASVLPVEMNNCITYTNKKHSSCRHINSKKTSNIVNLSKNINCKNDNSGRYSINRNDKQFNVTNINRNSINKPFDVLMKNKNVDFENRISNPIQCSTSQYHSEFCSVSQMQINNLPIHLRMKEVYDFIKEAAVTVVHLSTSRLSRFRLKERKFHLNSTSCFCENDDSNNICTESENSKSSKIQRYGTGWVCAPWEQDESCIRVITARHMIFDNFEAEDTKVTFFYDSPLGQRHIVAKGVRLYILDEERDFVILECITNDVSLKERLLSALAKVHEATLTYENMMSNLTRQNIDLDLTSNSNSQDYNPNDDDNSSSSNRTRRTSDSRNSRSPNVTIENINSNTSEHTSTYKNDHGNNEGGTTTNNIDVIIISHPHGGSKHVSFGTCISAEESEPEFSMENGEKLKAKNIYTYNTPTCPGSSGAPVIVLGKPGVRYFWTPHCFKNESGQGVSAKGLVSWEDINNNETAHTINDNNFNLNHYKYSYNNTVVIHGATEIAVN